MHSDDPKPEIKVPIPKSAMDRHDQSEAAAEDKTGPLALLPDDVLADVLRRLPQRSIAVSMCVCKSWLVVVDARRLLRADLLPLTLGGFFMNFYRRPVISEFFAPRPDEQRNAVYWRGALYVHCKTGCVMRLSLSSDKYLVIKRPLGIEVNRGPELYLGKSSEGICCASIMGWRVQVWNLVESGYQMEWVMKHDKDISKWFSKHKLEYSRPCANYGHKIKGPWFSQDINYYYGYRKRAHIMEAPTEEEIEWSSEVPEDEKFTWSSDDECESCNGYIKILGFHPCKDMIFLSELITRGLAYHLNSSKIEVLGNLCPAGYDKELPNEQVLQSSYPYRPCWLTQTTDDQE